MFENIFGIHEQALMVQGQRMGVLAGNLANADTPGYKARDIDFKAAMAAAGADTDATPGATAFAVITPGAMTPAAMTPAATLQLTPANAPAQPGTGLTAAGGSSAALDPATLKYRVPMAPSLDGNTVDEQLEQSAFAENSVRYQATLTFLNTKLHDLLTAITGS